VGDGALSHRQGVVGESIAEIVEGELELVGEGPGLGHRPPLVGKEEFHLVRRAKVALAAALEQAAGGVEGATLANAGEDVGEVAVFRPRVARATGRDQWQSQLPREIEERPVAVLLGAQAVALQFDVEPPREEMDEVRELAPGGVEAAVDEPLGEDTLSAAGQTVEAVGVSLDL